MRGRPDVSSLIADSGELLSISGLTGEDGRPAAIVFEFRKGILSLRCDDDTDEIFIEVLDDAPQYPRLSHELLSDLIGSNATYAWTMTNHRGFVDAFQLRCMDGSRREETRQFEVAASAIDVSRVNSDMSE